MDACDESLASDIEGIQALVAITLYLYATRRHTTQSPKDRKRPRNIGGKRRDGPRCASGYADLPPTMPIVAVATHHKVCGLSPVPSSLEDERMGVAFPFQAYLS